jgi:hypothetical protein
MQLYPESNGPGGRDFWRYISLSNFADMWSKVLLLSIRGKELNASEVFIKLMGLGTSLEWRGSPRENPLFIPDPALDKMKGQLPPLKVDRRLADTLNEDTEFLEMVRTIKPAGIEVRLTGMTRNLSPHNLLKKENLLTFLNYIMGPNEFIWEIYVHDGLSEPMNESVYGENIKVVGDLLNRAAESVIQISRREVLHMYSKLLAEKSSPSERT